MYLLMYIVIKSLVLDLILALQNQPASRILPSRIGDRTLAGDLGILYGRVDSNQLDIASAIPLVEQIVSNQPNAPTWNDADIWHAVFELVARTNHITPPTAFERAVFYRVLLTTHSGLPELVILCCLARISMVVAEVRIAIT